MNAYFYCGLNKKKFSCKKDVFAKLLSFESMVMSVFQLAHMDHLTDLDPSQFVSI